MMLVLDFYTVNAVGKSSCTVCSGLRGIVVSIDNADWMKGFLHVFDFESVK